MLSPKQLKEIRALTAVNDHGSAYQMAAALLGETALVEQFARINKRHLELGHLSWDLNAERHKAYQALMAAAKTKLDPITYQKLYQSC